MRTTLALQRYDEEDSRSAAWFRWRKRASGRRRRRCRRRRCRWRALAAVRGGAVLSLPGEGFVSSALSVARHCGVRAQSERSIASAAAISCLWMFRREAQDTRQGARGRGADRVSKRAADAGGMVHATGGQGEATVLAPGRGKAAYDSRHASAPTARTTSAPSAAKPPGTLAATYASKAAWSAESDAPASVIAPESPSGFSAVCAARRSSRCGHERLQGGATAPKRAGGEGRVGREGWG